MVPPYDEKFWIEKIGDLIDFVIHTRKLSRVRLHLSDPSITPVEKIKFKKIIAFFENLFKDINFMVCLTPKGQLSEGEKGEIIRESHGTMGAQHFGENKTIWRAREKGIWTNMERDIIEYVKRCPACQLYKKTRIRPREELIITDTLTEPNEKIAMDIYGPLLETVNGNKYILSIQDMLTKYLILIPLETVNSESIIDSLFHHYIYIFSSHFDRPGC